MAVHLWQGALVLDLEVFDGIELLLGFFQLGERVGTLDGLAAFLDQGLVMLLVGFSSFQLRTLVEE